MMAAPAPGIRLAQAEPVPQDTASQILASTTLDWTPARLATPGAWVGHVPFAFWLADALRPDLFVELGTHSGNSYFAFCQALAAIHPAARSYAVDTWQGDEHAGFYDEAVFTDVSAYNAEHYRAFSTLLRSPFDVARPSFADSSIDLLHIDGMHSYDSVRHDFETWQTALSSRAVVLFHDTCVRERGFGVWKLWHELRGRFPSFEFTHSHGLGVLGVGPDQAEPLRALFRLPGDADAAGQVRRRIAARGEAFQHSVDLSTVRAALQARTTPAAETETALRTAEVSLAHAEARLADQDQTIRRLDAAAAGLERQLGGLAAQLAEAGNAAQEQRAALQSQAAELAALRDALRTAERSYDLRVGEMAIWQETERVAAAAIVQHLQQALDAAVAHQHHLVHAYVTSTSWRVTRPLRAIVQRLKRAPGLPPSPEPAPPTLPARQEPPRPPPATVSTAGLKRAMRGLLRHRLGAFLASSARLSFPSPAQPEISIVLVLYNQAELTLACLESVKAAAGEASIELVIVDNASTDATAALLDRIDGATILRGTENLHFLRAMNRGAAAVRGQAMLLLNNDAQLLPGSLAAALRTLHSAPDIGAVGGRIILPDGTLQEAGSIIWQSGACTGYGRGGDPAAPEFTFQRDVDFCSGAFLLTWTSLWQLLGGFDERYAPAYYEEVDLCVRLRKAGFRVVFDPAVAILHFEFGSAAQDGDALALQAANFEVFRTNHAGWLADQPPMTADPLVARSARGSTLRVLVLEGAQPGIPALLARGAEVATLGPTRPPELDRRVELVSATDAAALLAARPGYYGAIVAADMDRLRPELAGVAGGAILLDATAGLPAFLAATPELHADPAAELPASRPVETDAAMAVPFGFTPPDGPAPRIAVICHLFHPDIAPELLGYLRNLGHADLHISTDTEAKRTALQDVFGTWDRGRVELTVLPNRGRDIAAKLVGLAGAHAGYDLVLHLHSKKSDHTAFLAPWRTALYETLLGSTAVVSSVLAAFAELPQLGMLAPLHYEAIRRWIGWNGNLPQARSLAARMGTALQPGRALDFPSGSMFWARPDALRPLLDLGLCFDDFPHEGQQQDHTTAHAIERLFFYSCEQSGYDWLKIADPALYADPSAIVPIPTPDALHAFATGHRVLLTGTTPIPIRPDPAPMMTDIPPGLAARLRAEGL